MGLFPLVPGPSRRSCGYNIRPRCFVLPFEYLPAIRLYSVSIPRMSFLYNSGYFSKCFVQIGHIRSMMKIVMNIHRRAVNIRLQCIVFEIQMPEV
jgi:hypothetical protein